MQSILRFDRNLYEMIIVNLNSENLLFFAGYYVEHKHYIIPFLVFLLLYTIVSPKRSLAFAVTLLLYAAFSETIVDSLKHLFERLRPGVQMGLYYSENALAFPSAHTFNTTALAVFMHSWFRKGALWLYLFAFFMGFFRIVTNNHFPLDVLGGFIFGYITGRLLIAAFNIFIPYRYDYYFFRRFS